jgi:hypothetical protein
MMDKPDRPDSTSLVEKRAETSPSNVERAGLGGSPQGIDAETEKRLLRKLDLRLIPMICWIYLMNFMDRGMDQCNRPQVQSCTKVLK